MKRILAMLLAVAMILIVVLMAGCNKVEETTTGANGTSATTGTAATTGGNESTTASDTTGSEHTTESIPTEPDGTGPLANYEDATFAGATITIAGMKGGSGGESWDNADEIYSDGADSVSVAIRNRNNIMKTLYQVEIKLVTASDPGTLASNDIAGNTHTLDIYSSQYNDYARATNGKNYNLYDLGLNLENPWWDQQWVNTYTIKNSNGHNTLYSVVGDFAIRTYEATHVIMFNKTVMENSPITEDVYELVKENKWTMDKFAEMIRLAATENSGNDKLAYSEGDIMGWVRTGHATHGMHVASSLPIFANNDGVLSLEAQNDPDTWVSIIDKAIEIWNTPGSETLAYNYVRNALQNDQTLFASEVLLIMKLMADTDSATFGLLPYPKYSESQENYAHYVDNHLHSYSIPISVPNPETVALFFELYAYHSRYLVRSQWIDAYSYEFCGDLESSEMLSVILDSRTYDPGYLFWPGNFEGEFSGMISNGKNNISQWVNRRATTAAQNITGLVSAISDNQY